MVASNLYAASFRGVPFFMDGETSTEAGRKGVTHEYPNARGRFFEDLGPLEPIFTLNGITKGQGNDYIVARDALRNALNERGTGLLVHPFEGSVQVSIKTFKLDQSQEYLGIAKFSMTFEKSGDTNFPTPNQNNEPLIENLSGETSDLIKEDFADKFNVSKTAPLNYADALSKMASVADAFKLDNVITSTSAEEISNFNAAISSYRSGLNQNIFDPTGLSESLFSIFETFDLVATTPIDQFQLVSNLFKFGSTDTIVPLTTVQRVERANNREITNSAMRAQSLVQAYNLAPKIDYTTDAELKSYKDELEEQYQFVNDDNNLSDATLNSLQLLRNEVRVFYERENANVFKIQTIQTNPIPVSLLAYRYYGSTDNTDQLINLNMLRDVANVNGDVKILAL